MESSHATRRLGKAGKALARDWQLLVLCLLPLAYYVVFHYTLWLKAGKTRKGKSKRK